MRVLLVEGPAVEKDWLRSGDIVVEAAESAEDALALIRQHDFDLVVLDLDLPAADGCGLLLRMRNSGVQAPVLAVSSASRPEVKIKALRAGAHDCVTTPLSHDQMLARMHAIVRRSRGYSQARLQVGPLQLDLDTRQVTVRGQEVRLTGKEFAILELLVLRKGMVLTKDALLNHLYGGMDEAELTIIDVFTCKIRRKLANAGCDGMIGTVWGRGYILREPPAVATTVRESLAAD